MFDSKSPLKKYVSYAVITFFCAIIIIAFGVPSFLPEITADRTTVALVNGEKINVMDFLRYRDNIRNSGDSRFDNMDPKAFEDMALNNYISDVLLLQKAREMGITVSEDRVSDFIMDINFFKDMTTGEFDPERLKMYLKQTHLSLSEFNKLVTKDLTRQDLFNYIRMGIATPQEDIVADLKSKKSRIQIKYAFASNENFKKKFVVQLIVSEQEISAEMEKNRGEVKDPATDRKRIREKLENRKLQDMKKQVIDRVNEIALKGGSFNEAAALLQGTVSMSNIFSIGDRPKENGPGGKPLMYIYNSKIFLEECMALKEMQTSRVISAPTGIYIFTPVLKDISKVEPPEGELETTAQYLTYEKLQILRSQLMQNLYENSKIIKKLKTN